MHRTLKIPELVDIIISELGPETSRTSARALAALACTCTTFHEQALDALWKSQNTAMNLLRCMPADLWDKRTLIPRRAVVTSDWDRVLKYSARVKFFVSDRRPSMTTVYEAIKDTTPGEYLLPHLEHLSWRHQSAACWPFIDLFLGPCITSVELSVQRGGPHPLLATLAQRYPELRSVSIEGLNARSDPSDRSQLSRFVRELKHLESLHVRTLDSEPLRYLGNLPALKSLVTLLPNALDLPRSSERRMFPNLRELSFSSRRDWDEIGPGIVPLLTFLRMCTKPPLRSFDANIEDWTLDQVEEFYQVLASQCAHKHLSVLQVHFMYMEPPTPHPGRFFRPLFSFTGISVVNILVPAGYDIDDGTVSDMARAWPRLELRLTCCAGYQSRCTLLSLASFAFHCPRLQCLDITLDASSAPHELVGSTDSLPQRQLTHLNVGCSPASDDCIAAAAAFISSVFSNLTTITECHSGERDMIAGRENSVRWNKIRSLVPGLEERRRKGQQANATKVLESAYQPPNEKGYRGNPGQLRLNYT
ncbi:hypothetical protein B0H11DRAFT_2273266 [Mycena galericulata]|nr:hypothetical protein B0H11DRAFT_2273266 [Mycena galericulata]